MTCNPIPVAPSPLPALFFCAAGQLGIRESALQTLSVIDKLNRNLGAEVRCNSGCSS
jgi:hypothetical protein